MIVHATDDVIPIYSSSWRIWHELIIRLHLFELAELREWSNLLGRSDSKGIRTPHCLARIPFGELPPGDWECAAPDKILLTWQAAMQDTVGRPVDRVGHGPPALTDVHALIDSIGTENIGGTFSVRGYADAALSLGLHGNYESLSAAQKMDALRQSGADRTSIADPPQPWRHA